MSSRATRLLLAAGAAACVACSPSDGSATESGWRTSTARDGDTLVVRTVGAPDSVTLRLVPELRIGEPEGGEEYGFARILAMAPAPAGGVYVWDRLMKSLRQYDSAGRFVRQVGRRGPGPGEYEAIHGLARIDSLLVFWDRENLQTSVYDTVGRLLGRWGPGVVNETNGSLHAGIGGRVYLRQLIRPRAVHEMSVIGYVSYDAWGTPGDTVPEVEIASNQSAILTAAGPRGGTVVVPPYVPLAYRTFSPLGYTVHGRSDRYALTLLRGDAPPLRIEREVAPVPISDDERDEEQAHVTEVLRRYDPGWRWTGERLPTRKPYWHQVRFDADGRLWVERAGASVRVPDAELPPEPEYQRVPGPLPPHRWREPMRHDLFEPDGRFLGTVAQPERSEFLYMRGDTVWGVVRDSLDVPYVTRWRIEPSIGVARAGAGDAR